MTKQEQLDKAAKVLWRLKKEADEAAIERCNAGDFDASERLHRIGAYLQLAYAEGRGLKVQDGGGVIQPFGGGK